MPKNIILARYLQDGKQEILLGFSPEIIQNWMP